MERTYESETKKTEIDIEFEEEDEEIEFTIPWVSEEWVDSAPSKARLYAQAISGFAVIVAMLFVPLVTLPGMVILVLIVEIYLLDWTYSKVNSLRNNRSSSATRDSTKRKPEDEIDGKVSRTGPKDQFVK